MKTIGKNIFLGLGLGSALFAVTGIAFDIASGGAFQLSNWLYTKMAVGAMVVGVGFSVPAAVYGNDRLPLGMQTLIHMGTGCTVFLIVAFTVGWIPLAAGWPAWGLVVLGQLLVAFGIWLCFALHYKGLAQKMNRKLRGIRGE